ncbi:energy transducer TonB [Oxalobacteraceae bacterium CAVE-383]|nr:energy transducer TonB [Oxalobacteraceae bacterium CAVE-383]
MRKFAPISIRLPTSAAAILAVALLAGCAAGSADLGAPYTADAPDVAAGQLPNPNPNLTSPPTIQARDMQFLQAPRPEYPAGARQRREQGTVIVRALVNTLGIPAAVSVFRSSGYPELDQAAARAVLAARYRPYLREGTPIAVYVQSPITFLLN